MLTEYLVTLRKRSNMMSKESMPLLTLLEVVKLKINSNNSNTRIADLEAHNNQAVATSTEVKVGESSKEIEVNLIAIHTIATKLARSTIRLMVRVTKRQRRKLESSLRNSSESSNNIMKTLCEKSKEDQKLTNNARVNNSDKTLTLLLHQVLKNNDLCL